MIKKLTEQEIAKRREAADGFWQSIQALEADAAQGKQQVKVLRAQIKEAQRNFDGLMDEIISGEVEVDDQQRLPL